MTGKGARQKGINAERELVDILKSKDIPSVRVLGSGSFVGAKADLKVGVTLDEDGNYPSLDECIGLFRAEVKNRKDNPEYIYKTLEKNQVFSLIMDSKLAPEYLYDHLNQDDISKCVIMRRNKIPKGSLVNKDYNNTHLVFMGLNDFMDLIQDYYKLKNKV